MAAKLPTADEVAESVILNIKTALLAEAGANREDIIQASQLRWR